MSEKYVFVVNKGFKGKIVSKRKDFMDLLIRVLGDNDDAVKELGDKFGTRKVANYNSSNSITILSDGEIEFKD